ncbi:MAG: FKBP-type peptidyl-prolyl cis-trans isomerase [Nitrospiraceae bacterium]
MKIFSMMTVGAISLSGALISGTGPAGAEDKKGETPMTTAQEITTPSGLKYVDLQVGSGDLAVTGSLVTVHYTGWLIDGTKFDSSVDRRQPFSFPLGAGRVIKGWDEGVAGMKVGGKRKLTIPSDLGYGTRGAGGVIPPNATLLFDVELLEVR